MAISHAFTAGELGYYTADLASRGLVGLAAANSSALVSIGKSQQKVLGTNPLSFAVPLKGSPLVIDQSITPSAFVTIREDRKSTRLNSSHVSISYAVFCLKKKKSNSRQC